MLIIYFLFTLITVSTFKNLDILPFFEELKNQNGLVVHFSLAGQACVMLNDPDDLKVSVK